MYKYKKEFFATFMQKNKIRREEIKRVLGTSSGNNLQLWLGEREPEPLQDPSKDTGDRAWLPLRHILKLCNHYGLHLSDFIENAEEPEVKQRRQATRTTTSQDLRTAAIQQQLMQQRIDHLQEVATLREQQRQREEAIKEKITQDYEKRMDDLRRQMETVITSQAETIQSLREQISVLRREEWERANPPGYASEPLPQQEAEKSMF